MKLGDMKILSNTKITILPNKEYKIVLNRRDFKNLKLIQDYSKRVSSLLCINEGELFSFTIRVKGDKVKRIKPLISYGSVIRDTMLNKC